MTSAVASIASSVIARPVIAAPPIAGAQGSHPDAALLELGVRHEAALASYAAAASELREREAAFCSFTERAPKVLRWGWTTDRGMPFTLHMRRSWREGEIYTDADVALLRARRWDCDAAGAEIHYTSGLKGHQVQARSDRIVAAFERWKPKRDAHAAALRLTETQEEVGRLDDRIVQVQQKIDRMPPAQTVEGLAVKSRSVLHQLDIGFDQEAALTEIARDVLRLGCRAA